jgi:hypothetical protein
MIPKSAITFRVTDSPDDPEKFVGTAEQTTRIHWLVGKTGWTANDHDSLKLSLTRRIWTVLYGDIRSEMIEVMNDLRNIPSPEYGVVTAIDKIEAMLLKLNLPHPEDLE